MTGKEFIDRYYTHDSTFEKIKVADGGKTVTMEIEIPFWMQNDYQKGDPEIVTIEICFRNVTHFDCPEKLLRCSQEMLEEYDIGSNALENGAIVFRVFNDYNGECHDVRIKTDEVEVKILPTE